MMLKLKTLLLVAIIGILMYGNTAHAFDSMHGAKAVPKLNYDSLWAMATPIEKSPNGQALIERLIATYGGMEKLKDISSLSVTYAMKAFLNRDTVDVEKSLMPGRRYRITRKSGKTFEERILNGTNCWFQNRDTLMFLNSGRYKAELFSFLTLSMPQAIKMERFDAIRYGVRAGDSLQYLYFDKKDSLLMAIGIDPVDNLIKTSEGMIRQDESEFVFINHLSDYRKIQGFYFPYHLVNISMGLEVARSTVKNINYNVDLPKKVFLPNEELQMKMSK